MHVDRKLTVCLGNDLCVPSLFFREMADPRMMTARIAPKKVAVQFWAGEKIHTGLDPEKMN